MLDLLKFLETDFENYNSWKFLRKFGGNLKQELLNLTVLYRQMIEEFVNVFSRQATTTALQCVRMKYGDP